MLMTEELKSVLRSGLIASPQKRQLLIRELANYPDSSDKNYVVAALKDPTTSLDDIDSIIEGSHYKQYLTTVKPLLEGVNDFAEVLDIPDKEQRTDGNITVQDSFGQEQDLKIHVAIEDVDSYVKHYNAFIDSANEEDSKSLQKAVNALHIFNTKLSDQDKKDIEEGINKSMNYLEQKKKYKSTKKQFIHNLNEQLDEDERIQFIGLLLKQARTSFQK